jgi:hypothetical protein
MPEDCRYEAAIATALAVIHELSRRPGMSRPEQLSTITFLILDALRRVEAPPPPTRLYTQPSIN